jgi:hypothetical protein
MAEISTAPSAKIENPQVIAINSSYINMIYRFVVHALGDNLAERRRQGPAGRIEPGQDH